MHKLPDGVTFIERGWLSSNNVLIQDTDQAVLVDTGYWTHAHQTASLVASALNDRPLTAIINTHLHSDHCGGNAHLQDMYPLIRTFIPPGHSAYVDAWDAEALTYVPTGQFCPIFCKTDLISNGDSFSVGHATWHAYSTPGHDPNAIVLFQERDGVLISADSLWENGFGVVFPEIEGTNAFDEVEDTLKIIEQLNPRIVLPGHGSAFTDVAAAISRAKSRLRQFRENPEKHALYAAKVLLKFKLLELQKVKLIDLIAWADSVRYLKLLQKSYPMNSDFDAWIFNLCRSLETSGACEIDEPFIVNSN